MSDNLNDTMPGSLFRKKLLLSMLIPLVFIILLWLIMFMESQLDVSFYYLGIYPLEARGLPGIITSPFIHNDYEHLFNNTIPLFVLGTAVFYFYSDIAFKISGWSWLLTGLLVWIAGRESWHIGASGLVYSLASFLFFSGIIRRYFRLMALSLLIVFLYGSMVWGMFPFLDIHISWESHMLGAGAGLILAVLYRKQGPQSKLPGWYYEDEHEDEDEDNDDYNEIINIKNQES